MLLKITFIVYIDDEDDGAEFIDCEKISFKYDAVLTEVYQTLYHEICDKTSVAVRDSFGYVNALHVFDTKNPDHETIFQHYPTLWKMMSEGTMQNMQWPMDDPVYVHLRIDPNSLSIVEDQQD
jgi:hypothetical protein